MTEAEKKAFEEAMCARTRMLRKKCNLPPQQIADLLGVELETYKKYETRTAMPRHLIPKFARFVGASIAFFMTGYDEF
jgi:DNA-binding transcriptional regulator YiaG